MAATPTKPAATEVTRWGNVFDAFPWNARLGQLMDSMWHTAWRLGEFPPSGDLEEREDAYVLEVDMPGIEKKDVTVDVAGRRVAIHGAREEIKREGVLRHSTRMTGSFSYEFALPTSIDETNVSAILKDGILTVTLPKADGARSTHVPIT